MKIFLIIVLVLLLLVLLVWMVGSYIPVRNIETPAYEVTAVKSGYEIRRYAPHIVAEVELSGNYEEALNQGFRTIAGYIFGGNTASGSIAMTAPVLHGAQPSSQQIAMTAPVLHGTASDVGRYKIAFVMPKTYTLETLPKPNDAKISLRQVPAKNYAVLQFRGRAPEATVNQKMAELTDLLKRDNLTPLSAPVAAEYNPPWTIPFMRHNEIMVEVP